MSEEQNDPWAKDEYEEALQKRPKKPVLLILLISVLVIGAGGYLLYNQKIRKPVERKAALEDDRRKLRQASTALAMKMGLGSFEPLPDRLGPSGLNLTEEHKFENPDTGEMQFPLYFAGHDPAKAGPKSLLFAAPRPLFDSRAVCSLDGAVETIEEEVFQARLKETKAAGAVLIDRQ